ncbi:MAG: hypothetical protein WBG57_09760 [Ornithinimicrobium sp.]
MLRQTSRRATTAIPPGRCGVIGVLGATGGLGASTVSAVLAMRSALSGRSTVLIDGHRHAGGLYILLALDGAPGLRWPDLSAARGDLDGPALLGALPSVRDCHVLSWGRSRGAAISGFEEVCRGLVSEVALGVIDLPGAGAEDAPRWWAMCDHLLLLIGSGVRELASAAVVLDVLQRGDPAPDDPRVMGLLRQHQRAGVTIDSVSALLGIPMLATLASDRHVDKAVRVGEAMGLRTSPLAQACDLVLHSLADPLVITG